MSALTNAELNLSLAKLLYPDATVRVDAVGTKFLEQNGVGWYLNIKTIPDYLNNWNDLMPLVVEHEIELRTAGMFAGTGLGWSAFHNPANQGKTLSTLNDNPQRALVECLLKVLESKDG